MRTPAEESLSANDSDHASTLDAARAAPRRDPSMKPPLRPGARSCAGWPPRPARCWCPRARRRARRARQRPRPSGNGCRVDCRCAARAFTKTTNRSSSTDSIIGRRCPIRATGTPRAGIRCGAIWISAGHGHQHAAHHAARPRAPTPSRFRIVPSLQPDAGKYDPASVTGLLRLCDELKNRGVFAILIMNNFWHWSGGFCQYLAWAGKGPRAVSAAVPGWQLGHLPAPPRRSSTPTTEAVRDLQQPAQAHRAAAGVEPDGDLGAGQRAARHEQREGVRPVDRRHRAPDPFDGARASWSPPAARGRPRSPSYAGRRHGARPPEPVHRLHHVPPLGRELGLAARGQHRGHLPQGAGEGQGVHQRSRRARRQARQAAAARGVRLPARRAQLRRRLAR